MNFFKQLQRLFRPAPSAFPDGQFLDFKGAKIWYKISGRLNGPATVFLHGGPGYNSYAFEKCVGAGLEKNLRMIYLDQRDCGRSKKISARAPVDLKTTVSDIEQIRIRSGFEKLNLVGHSFGGLVALEYQKYYPAFVEKIVFVDITFDLVAAFENQFEQAARSFPEHAKSIAAIRNQKLPVFKKIQLLSEVVGHAPFQKSILWYSDLNRQNYVKIDASSKLPLKSFRLIHSLEEESYLNSSHPELAKKLPVPGLLLSGRSSECMGAQNLQSAAAAWGVPMVWFEKSGHFPYAEEPDAFTRTITRFLTEA